MNRKLWFLLFLLTDCNSITTGDKLSKTDIQRIQQLGLLDKGEKIVKFYSQLRKSVAGNFFTDKRLATYWLDEKDESKNIIATAFYRDIISIDTVCYVGLTYSPYMLVTRNDSSTFKVFFDGKKDKIRKTFLEAIKIWHKSKTDI